MKKIIILFMFAQLISTSANGSLLTNGDIETGTLVGWDVIYFESQNDPRAIDYSQAPGTFGSIVPLVPTYEGGTFGVYIRTGTNNFGAVDVGFEQTVTVTPGTPLFFSLDFAVRELQIPGQSRAAQTVNLRLNGGVVAQQFFDNPSTEFGHFEGIYTPQVGEVTFSMTALRPLLLGTGFGQVFFDNAVLTAVPIPASISLFASGAIAFFGVARRNRKVFN